MRTDFRKRTWVGLAGQMMVLLWLLSQVGFAQTGASDSDGSMNSRLKSQSNDGIAVVELFTSQGCSSCPSADEVLQQIAAVAQRGDLPVYTLSFHVDYWNRLGWNDPYSAAAYSGRQRAYASAMNSRRIYTPQMIVNGTNEFVGSNRALANDAVTRSLKVPASSAVRIKVDRDDASGDLGVTYQVDDSARGRLLHLAIVDSPKPNSVPRGENAGRSLSHVNVVRAFESVSISSGTGIAEIHLSEASRQADVRCIAYVQDPATLSIIGATVASIPKPM